MSRPLRIEYPGAWYHVMNRGRRREKIFFDERDYTLFLYLLGQCFRLFEFEVHAYALMPNHYHLLVRTPLGNLSRAMRHLDGVFTQRMNKRYGLDGSLLRGRFKSILIDQENYLVELVRYIHRNPTKAGLEKTPGQYPWTSHPAYTRDFKVPRWLKREMVFNQFGRTMAQAQEQLDQFVRRDTPEALEKVLDGARWPALLGSESFRNRVKENWGSLCLEGMDTNEVPQVKEMEEMFSMEVLLRLLSQATGDPEERILQVRRGEENLARRALIFLARERLKLRNREIGAKLGALGPAAVSNQYVRAVAEIQARTGCYQKVKQAEAAFREAVKCQM